MYSNRLVVDISDGAIRILYGTRKRIKQFGLLKIPEGSMTDSRMLSIDSIRTVIQEFLNENNINAKKISYVISGQELIVRNMEIPAIGEKNIEESVRWELNRSLPEGGKDYYIDHQINGSSGSGKSRVLRTLTVAAPADRIEQYVELSDSLNQKLQSVDIFGNSIARVFDYKKKQKEDNGAGIIYFGNVISRMCIIEKGSLIVEREVPFGLENLKREIMKRKTIEAQEASRYLGEEFGLHDDVEENELNDRLRQLINNVFSSFQKVIQFYVTGRTNKNLDEIFVTGFGVSIPGLENYVAQVLRAETTVILEPIHIGSKLAAPPDFDFRHYLGAYGMLLRREE